MTPGLMVVALALAGSGPRLDAPAEPVAERGAVVLALSGGGPLLIDSCAPVELEHKVGSDWVGLAPGVCATAQAATVVDGPLTLTVPAPATGEYRAAVAWGAGCSTNLPFHLSSCKKLGVVRSAAFRVGIPADVASPGPAATPAPVAPDAGQSP